MAVDPLRDLFGTQPDPLADVFGQEPNREFETGPLPETQLVSDLKSADADQARHIQVEDRSRAAVQKARESRDQDARIAEAQKLGGGGAAFATEDQKHAADDPLGDLFGGGEAGWNATLAMMRQNRADFAITVHGPTKELLDASAKAKQEADAINATAPDGDISQVGYNIANLAASMFSSGKQAAKAAAAGAAVGAAGGAAAGAPAGGVGAVPGAIAGAVGGGAIGLTAGFIGDSYVTNAGQIMGDLRQAGVDPKIAKTYGMAGGAIMAGLDLFGIGFAARPFVKAAERRVVQKEVSRALLSETAKDYFLGIAGETGAETAQQIVQDVTTDLAKQATGGNFETIFNDPKRRREVVNNAVQTAIATAEGMTVLGLPGVAVDSVRARRAQGQQAGVDDLGRSPVAAPPAPGRTYNVADAIAELGMTPDEAQSFVSSGKDPRGNIEALDAHGFTAETTPEDRSSPISDTVIAEGKGMLGDALREFDQPSSSKTARLPGDILGGLIKRGIPEHIARGVSAGTIAEANGDPTALNKQSGAFGIGQWLGPRKDELFRRYGSNPSLDQQLDFLVYELKGGDQGGASVLGAQDEVGALNAYIKDFMRPGPGVNPDLTRGMAALGQAGEQIADLTGVGKDSPQGEDRPALTVEGTLAKAGVNTLGPDVDEFAPNQRLDVTRNGETVPGTVQEVYGQGDNQGVRVALDNGDTFDEVVKQARDYGARLTHPSDSIGHALGPTERPAEAPKAKLSGHAILDIRRGKEVELDSDIGPITVFKATHGGDAAFGVSESKGFAIRNADGTQTQFVQSAGLERFLEGINATQRTAAPTYAGAKIDGEFTAFHPDTGTIGIPRAEMPQIKQEHRGAFVNYAEARGITHEEDTVPAASLKPTQAEFAPAKVQKFLDNDAGDRAVLVSSDGYVLDGHHQWVAALDKGGDVRVIRLNASIRDLLPIAHDFPSATTSGETTKSNDGVNGPRVFVNEVGPDGQTDAERGRKLTDEERSTLHQQEHEGFVRSDTLSVLNARAKMNAKFSAGEVDAFTKGVAAETGYGSAWRKEIERTNINEPHLKVAYNKGRAAAVKELRRRGVAPVGKELPGRNLSEQEQGERAAEREAQTEANRRYPDSESRVGFIAGTRLDNSIHLTSSKQAEAYAAGAEFAGKSAAAESTAPEHAAVGVDDRELEQIVADFGQAADSLGHGEEQISHIFDEPNAGIVRLNQKTKVYHKDHGWMTPAEAAKLIDEWEAHAVAQGKDPKARRENGDKVVLSLFDLSGAWSEPWEQAGYQVFRFDIQNDPEVGDVHNFSTDFFADWFGDFDGKDIYAILAACPCTDFASSGARHFAAKDKDGRTVSSVKLVHQTLATIEHFKPAIWALENPVGRIQKLGGLPHWRMSFDPNDVGDPYTKKTLLWGRFNGDLPIAPVEPTEGSKIHTQYGGKSLKTKNARSVTPRGFSYAFFMANNAIDHQAMAISNKYDRLDQSLIAKAVKAGVTEQQIDEAVEDHYYQDLDDQAANAAIQKLIEVPVKSQEPIADQPTEAPVNVAAAEALRTKAQPHQEELVAWGQRWQRQGEEYGFIDPGMKSAARIVEKLQKEGYESLAEIKDVARVGFKVADRNRATDLAVSAQRAFGAENVTDKGWRMVDGDYFDRKLIVSWPDGTKGEIQIIPDALETFRHEGGGAELYTQWRSTEPGPEKDALLRKMEDGYAKAAEGTSWESLFSELKSASGNALAAAASESEGPGVVAKPGAGRQTLADDQTTAQGLPETAPEATSRSSTSKSENAATTDNVGNAPQASNVSAYGSTNRIFTKDKADAARDLIREKLRTQVSAGFDPEFAMAGMQLAGFHIEAGARKFAALSKAIADDLGTELSKLKPYIAAWYNGARDLLEGQGEDISDMDGAGAVRAAVGMIPEPSVPTSVGDIGENGGTNAGTSADQGVEGADRAGDARAGTGNALGTESVGEPGQGADGQGEPSPGELRGRKRGSGEPGVGGEAQPAVPGNGERTDAGVQQRGPRSARSSRRVRDDSRGADYLARPGDLARTGSWHEAADRNLDIIELVKKLDEENRPATPEEQALLAKWVGWGASEIRNKLFGSVDRRTMTIHQPYGAGEWADTINRARELLTGKDLETALQSTQYAHYTSEEVIRGMWDAMQRMGFEGGRILEPGMGIGHFFTAAPAEVHDHSTYTGIELDAFTAKIAKYLLPQENVLQGDFAKQALPDGFFDVAIGNPPFSSTKVLNDPAYKKLRLSLHNYFFAKSLDKIRPGGILAFITSRYTMDALDPKAREFMAARADLVGAIRLPETAFKANAGTEVVTDILFFQRRAPDAVIPAGRPWEKTEQVSIGGQKKAINEYFAAHPEMVLGKHVLTRGMYRDNDLTVEPFTSKGSLAKQLSAAIGHLPENIYAEAPKAAKEAAQAKTFERDFAPTSTKEGGVYVKDGKVLVVDRGSGVPVEAIRDNLKAPDHAWLKGYTKLRDLLKDAQKAQLQDDADWEKKLDALRSEYRRFTKQNGRIKEFTTYERTTTDEDGEKQTLVYRRFKWDRLLFDIESPMVESLEKITDAGEIEDGPFLKGRTLNKPTRPKIETVEDALAVTLDEVGKLDLAYVGKLVGKDSDEVVRLLGDKVFQTPAGEWQTDDEYLSGDVLKKLEEAKVAAAAHPELERNVQALIAVQPKPLSYDRITVKLGAPWIRPETVTQFAEEVLGMTGVPITYEPATAHWNVEGAKARFRRTNTAEYGTEQRSPLELLESVLNNSSIKVTYKDENKKTVVDANATAAANEAAKKISDRFKTWLWEDSARTSEYVDIYNRGFNNLAPRRFDGSHLTLPGLSTNFKPHPHVKRAVWRIIQTGNTYLAHAVGAGKTAEQIIGAMEQRRLGLIKKPMFAVPNHMLKQFSQEFLQLYPAANIMVADEQAFHTGNRRRFLAQASLNDPDAIIVTHSSFGKIDTSPAMRERIVGLMVAELETAMEDAKGEDAPRHLVSRIEKQIETLKRRFEGRTGTGKDKLLTFDEMGVDQLLIDEAHEFRKLDFATNRSAKGIDAQGSARALDLFIKSQWLEQQNPGRSLIMASGTPVTNTMAELYTVMRFMALKDLEGDRISAFDAWANMFGEVAPGYERNAAGGYEIVERFAKFVNVPELMKRVRRFMDVLTSAELGDLVVRPKINGGGPANVIVSMSEELDHFMKDTLNARLETSRAWKPSKEQPGNPDPVINIITDARLSSIDMRYVSRGRKADPDSKLNQMIAKIAAKHHEFAGLTYTNKDGTKQPRKGAAQIVFSPVGLGEQVALNRDFDVRGWIDSELQRLGVKKSEIGWMSDANTHAKKDQLQKDVRSGKVRILIGSPKNMGTGLNVQDRLKALHFLAPPWYPADVTQPHGRIERQGNQNGDIDIYWYATEGTYDSTGWGMVARKQKFIDDAMAGDDSVRTLEAISEINMFEMAAALAAGDDRVIRIAELGGEVERLTRLKGAHADTQRSLRSDIQSLEGFELPRLTKEQADLKRAQDAKGGYQPFALAVNGKSFDKHGEAGEALKAAMQSVIDNHVAIPERSEIGRLYGKFPIYLEPTRHGDLQVTLDVGGTRLLAGRSFEKVDSLDNVGIVRSVETAAQRITSDLQDSGRKVAAANDMLAKAKAKFGAPFPEEQQLSDAIAERNRLQAEMTAETEAKNKPKAQVRTGDEFTLAPDNVEAFRTEMERQLRQILPNDTIALRTLATIDIEGPDGKKSKANGQYHPWLRMISIAEDTAQPSWTLGHEALHAMRSLGLFTEQEWQRLADFSWADKELQQRVRDGWGPLGLTEEQMKEEAVAENFGEYWDFHQMAETPAQKLFTRAAFRALRFIAAIRRAIRTVLGKPDDGLGTTLKLLEQMRKGYIGNRPEGFGGTESAFPVESYKDVPAQVRHSIAAPITPGSPDFGGETEKRWQDANGTQVDGAGFLTRSKTAFQHFVEGWSRHFEHLPNSARFADVKEQLRKLEAAPEASYEKVVRHLTALVGKLTPEEYDIMKRKVVLDDLAWEADREHALPFGFTPQTLREARLNIDTIARTMPKVTEAVRQRKAANYALAKQLVAAGVLTSEQIRNPAYYRHMVLDYARAQIEAAKNGGTMMVNGKPVRVRTPYWARRKGSSLDINSNLLEAEADWMLKAHTDIQTATTLNWLKASEHNIRDDLRKRAKAANDEGYAEALKHNPSAAKEDGRLRSMMARGYAVVKSVLEAEDLDIPDEFQASADAIVTGSKSDGNLAFLAWLMDGRKPGSEGAGMVLAGIGGRKKLMRKLLDDKFTDPDDIKGLVKRYRPEGFTDWQPLEGQHLFTAKTVSESVLDLFVSKLSDEEYPGVDKDELEHALGQVRPQLVVGRDRYTMVIPDEIAATLNDFGDTDSRNMFLHAVAGLQAKWKQYILINPRRWFRYNFNNMTGDLDALIAGKASALTKVPQALRELIAVSRGKTPSAAYKEALERGVFQAGITRQEVPDITQFKGLRHLEREKAGLRPDRLAVQLASNIWGALKNSTQFRESLFRYATYLRFKGEIDAGKAPADIGYGASNPALVDAVTDPADRAALLARELIGDYGNVSVFGQRMRRYIMPFWSWPEINTKRYFRLTANAFQTGYLKGAATGGLLGAGVAARTSATLLIRMSLVFALINLWNRWLHGDDEDKLDDQQQRQLHLILGHDKNGLVYTLRMQGALSDVLDELGFSDTVEAYKNWEDGKSSFADILTATPKAIINRVGPGNWNPLYMEPIQLALREKLWPDLFHPRTIHDRSRDVAQTFSLENEYDALAHKPTQGYGRSWVQSLAYQRDPGEMAYNNTRDLVGQWMREKEGLEIGRADISPRSEALRDYKLALKYGDLDAARKALTDYAKFGGTPRGLKQSIKGAAPLKPLPKRDRRAFVESLTDDQRDELIEAQRWYEETYLRR
jgi:N12 class adenine-specific DNA methylase